MRAGSYEVKLVKRVSLSNLRALMLSVIAGIVALFAFGFVFVAAGIDPLVAYQKIFSFAFFNDFGLPLTINRFIFLLLCTYAFIIPFRAGLWNIGMPGQLYAGSLAAFGVLHVLDIGKSTTSHISPLIIWGLMLAAAAAAAAAVGAIAGFLKGKYDINEIVVTMMLNYMVYWLVSYMIKEGGPFMNPGGRGESFELPSSLHAPLIWGSPYTLLIALALGLLLFHMFAKTKLGYEIRAYGQNPAAASYAGISRFRIPLLVFILGGAIAGLAGYHYFGAVPGVYKIARNYGFFGDLAFYGIICGLISRGNSLASIPVAFLFGGLSVGGRYVQGELGMSFGLDYAMLGVLMITLVAFQFFYQYQIVTAKIRKETSDVGILH